MATRTFGESPGVRMSKFEVHLETRHPGQRAGGGADLGGEVGQRGDVVSELGGLGGEPVSGELHPVA